jgi:biotin carboxylase
MRAARGQYDIVFAVQESDPECAASIPLLERMAPVIRCREDMAQIEALKMTGPAGIATFSESQLSFTAELAQRLGLRFHSPRTVGLLTHKVRQRRAMNAAGVSVTRFEAVADPAELLAAANRVGFPVVVKPAVGNSSRWTARADTTDDVDRLVDEALARPDAPDEWIVEEMLPRGAHPYGDVLADFVSVESVVQEREVSHFGITDRLSISPPFRERGLLIPTLLQPEDCGPLFDLATAALRALDVRWGVTHTEIKLTGSGPRVIEVNGRLGGWLGELMRRVATTDPVRTVLDVAVGLPVDVRGTAYRTHAAVLLVQPPEGRYQIAELADATVFRQQPGVWQAWKRAEAGDVVDSRAGSLQALYAAYVEGDRTTMADRLRLLETIGRDAAVLRAEL